MKFTKDSHQHNFKTVHKKVVPVRSISKEKGVTSRDTMTARDTIYYYKCEDAKCRATQAFHLNRERL